MTKRIVLRVLFILILVNAYMISQAQPATDYAHQMESLRLAIEDLIQNNGGNYPQGQVFLAQLTELESNPNIDKLNELKAKALLANPLVQKFNSILAIRRNEKKLGLPANWESNSSLPHTGYKNDLISIPVMPDGNGNRSVETVYTPSHDEYIGELDLHFNAQKVLFSKPAMRQDGGNGRWQLFQYDLENKKLEQISTIDSNDVDNYDGCYLPPEGDSAQRIIFTSTAPMVGVPCVRGSSHVTNTYVLNSNGTVRQLTFDQEHNWNPTVMENGRIMYLRWEYTDIPHAFYRLLFTMNPDGTNQVEYYGSNSYWPNSMFNAKPTPGNPNRFFAVVVGHHDTARAGQLILFDTSKSNFEADGVVVRIGQRGQKVEPTILDGLTRNTWPKFLHPAPLSDKYVITACQPNPSAKWGIYLVDVFDNSLLLYEQDQFAILEPIPLQKTPIPPAIADRTDPESKQATVFLADIYAGPGLQGINRGEIKQLRIFTYNFSYQGMGGQVDRVGFDGPWDVRSVLGTVPVESDGSAHFIVPANVPIALQPLDENGAAVQLFRSWFTAMPGEVVSCVGCHQKNNMAPVRTKTIAGNRPASVIAPFYGSERGFSFMREVQPVLDKYCVACHADSPDKLDNSAVIAPFSLANTNEVHLSANANYYNNATHFAQSYLNLKKYVRGHTIESDCHLLSPREFHVSTTRLFQTLKNDPCGHYGVAKLLQPEDWDRLTTWVDMNTPYHGTWAELSGNPRTDRQSELREQLRQKYAGIVENQEGIVNPYTPGAVKSVLPAKEDIAKAVGVGKEKIAIECKVLESTDIPADRKIRQIKLPSGEIISFAYVPKGTLNGQSTGGFWISQTEITNAQFNNFDPSHDSRYEFGDFLVFSLQDRGFMVNGDKQPVVRVSYQQAQAFCDWLNKQTDSGIQTASAALPSLIQWQYSAKAGSNSSDLWFGDLETDFSKFANLSDQTNFKIPSYSPWSLPDGAIPAWRPAEPRFNDGFRATAPVASFTPNAWGLYDVHGNAAEWVTTPDSNQAVAVGGSFNSRPGEAAFSAKQTYPVNQPVYDVGFRVILTDNSKNQ